LTKKSEQRNGLGEGRERPGDSDNIAMTGEKKKKGKRERPSERGGMKSKH